VPELHYTIERTRNRNSRAVLRGDTVVIRLARGLPPRAEQEHIDNLFRRMVKAHAKQAAKTVIDPFGVSDKKTDRALWRQLSHSALPDITRLVHEINERTLRVPIRSVKLKFMKSRWGSCSHHGNITLATPLLFTSPEILEYVIIHELAHIIHKNHSARFWKTVAQWNPDYKDSVKKLRQTRLAHP
jgi:predicted metal-dependent hydrolase